MDSDWDEVCRVPLPPPGIRGHPTPVSTLSFDTSQELLWAGNEYGRVSSFYGAELQQYTSFKAHKQGDGKVHQLLFNDKGVIALGSRSVHMAMRRGPPLWHIKHEDMKELRCMAFTSRGTAEILVAGEQDKMFVIDVNKGEVVKILPTEHHYKIMRRSRHICAATTGSAVHILDSVTFKVSKVWTAHAAAIHDMDAQHDFIVACGVTPRQQGYSMFSTLVHVFDLKNMVSMNPVPFPAGAAYVRMHPRMSTTSIVVSQNGQIHVVDLMNPNTSNVRQANSFTFTTIDIAPSGEAVALADGEFNIHLWGSVSKIHFAELANPVEFAQSGGPMPSLDWNDNTPLSSVGMPYYREVLLSAWPRDSVYEVGAPPTKEDTQFLATLQRRDWGLFGKNTRGVQRNQIEDTRSLDKEQSLLKAPKFLSEKARSIAHTPAGTPAPEEVVPEMSQALVTKELESHKVDVPESYGNIEIMFSKYGIDDFDFGFYNPTQYAGLQNHIVNCYANALLQVMHFTPLIRNIALQHAATDCSDELCLLCELGFLFDMLHKAEGAPCHASNLLKIVSYHPQATNMGLLEDMPHTAPRTAMLQNISRFILDKIAVDYKRMDSRSSAMEDLLETSATSSIKCNNCASETSRAGSSFVHELMYTTSKSSHRNSKGPKTTFSQVLKKSVERDMNSKGWCQTCHKYQTLGTKKNIQKIPAVLTLLAAVQNDDHRRIWATPGWLPEEIGVIVNNGQFFCYEGDELKYQLQRGYYEIAVYSLTGVAVNIETGHSASKGSHLVAMANVAHSAPEAPGRSQWYLFNDFHVKPLATEEALAFNTSWKTPSVIIYQRKEANNDVDTSWQQNIDTTLLYNDWRPALADKTYRTLNAETEKVGPNTIIAIDTEFVSISKPEVEISSDGDPRTIRPTVHALARTSVLRGSGIDEGVPFIDDYVHIRENVVDYLTAFSGITPEDLDPNRTRHNLVPLKVAYKKMWILLNLGCKFLGHGLKQDFRVINMHVPRSQIIDTSDKFFLPERRRKFSLQFLAWCLLKEDIQQDTHDSIEDSRTALRLYRKYEEFVDAGILEAMLQDIWMRGTAMNFKPPAKQGSTLPRTDTPPVADGAGPSTPVKRGTPAISGLGSSPGWTPSRGSNLGWR
ncbi:exonuclease [Pseudomassariella vexata]|uniref:PAN2-PAN3 deadenylation complex catalytic subunit PAN2 n=1 Tax=Pseudomassariella vexata TaxID=1141098 RepID=A0A1Y2DTQ8_9PEZI|nr:exonuclease [Pseudomassariella vexata]ORY62658.1 exonuclease [Pseudomassariella vexata]